MMAKRPQLLLSRLIFWTTLVISKSSPLSSSMHVPRYGPSCTLVVPRIHLFSFLYSNMFNICLSIDRWETAVFPLIVLLRCTYLDINWLNRYSGIFLFLIMFPTLTNAARAIDLASLIFFVPFLLISEVDTVIDVFHLVVANNYLGIFCTHDFSFVQVLL